MSPSPRLGAIVGSGGLVVMDEDSCMVDVANIPGIHP
jgi:NADH:ubiquinone oxidoreductase subunit F (NADH-binding)